MSTKSIQKTWSDYDMDRVCLAINEENVGGMVSYPADLFYLPSERMYCNPTKFPMQLINLASYMDVLCWDKYKATMCIVSLTNELHTIYYDFGINNGNTKSQAYTPGNPIEKSIATIRAACDVLI